MTGSYGTLIETLRFGLDSVSWLEVELAAFLCSAAAALASARTTTRELGHVLLCLDDGKYVSSFRRVRCQRIVPSLAWLRQKLKARSRT